MAKSNTIHDPVWNFSKPRQKVQWTYDHWFDTYLRKRMQYSFVQETWNWTIPQMLKPEWLKIELNDPVPVRLNQAEREVLVKANHAGVKRLFDLLALVENRNLAEAFCKQHELTPVVLKSFLQKIYRFFPTGTQMRQLVAEDDQELHKYINTLTKHKLGNSLALLEAGRTQQDRQRISKEIGILEEVLLDLVRRADMTRLMSGGMIRVSWALGYHGLKDYKYTTAQEYANRVQKYYEETSKGKPFDLTMKNVESHVLRMQQAKSIVEE